jgi:hypothetical protein
MHPAMASHIDLGVPKSVETNYAKEQTKKQGWRKTEQGLHKSQDIVGSVDSVDRSITAPMPSNSDLEFIGDDVVPNTNLRIFSFLIDIHEGEPTLIHDPDHEATEYKWSDELPSNDDLHVPPEDDITLKLLGIVKSDDLNKSDLDKDWISPDGLRIPHITNPSRQQWDKKYLQKVADVFANGDINRLHMVKVPVKPTQFTPTRNRRTFYVRMLLGGDIFPSVVVDSNGKILDGLSRMAAASEVGLTELNAIQLN